MFAIGSKVHLTSAARIALFAAAWLIYLADRVGDSFTIPKGAPMSLRQRAAVAHRPLFAVLLAISIAVVLAASTRLDHRALLAGTVVAVLAAIYLAVNHFFGEMWRVFPLKEFAIGTLFAAGTCVATSDAIFSSAALLLFALLCSINCLSIAFWERDLDLRQGRNSFATVFPRLQSLPLWSSSAVSLVALSALMARPRSIPMICLSISSALLALLNVFGARLTRDSRVALADIVLLTPLPALFLREF